MSADSTGSDGPSRRDILKEMNDSPTDFSERSESEAADERRRGFLTKVAISALASVGLVGGAEAKVPTDRPDANLASPTELETTLRDREDLLEELSDQGLLRESDAETLAQSHQGASRQGILFRAAEAIGITTDERAVKRELSINDEIEEEFVEFLHSGPEGTLRLELGRNEGLTRISTPEAVDDQELIDALNENLALQSDDCEGDWEVPCTCPTEYGCSNITSSHCDDICGSTIPGVPSACNSCDCVVTNCCDCDCNCAWSYSCDCECQFPAGNCNSVPCC